MRSAWHVVAAFAILVVCLMIASGERSFKDDGYRKVRDYVQSIEPRVARHAYNLAVEHGCITEVERRKMKARLDNLRGVRAITSDDSYRRVIVMLIQSIVYHCREQAECKSGIDREKGGDELQRHLKRELEPFTDVLEMDRILNTLSDDYPGVSKEYEKLRPRMDELLKNIK